jgi:hypothetical protein
LSVIDHWERYESRGVHTNNARGDVVVRREDETTVGVFTRATQEVMSLGDIVMSGG